MTSITMSFLLYFNQRLWIMALSVALALGSKYVLRVRRNGRFQHFMNPSNFGIAIVLITYQWTGVLPWASPSTSTASGTGCCRSSSSCSAFRLNMLFTGRLPTVFTWLGTFILLGIVRAWILNTPIAAELVVLTGIPMVLFTLYMITDPQTSPSRLRSQIIFGAGIAFAYHVLLMMHVQYMMFYSVAAVCAIRGMCLFALSLREPAVERAAVPVTAPGV